MSDNYKDWKKYRENIIETADVLTEGRPVTDKHDITLGPTLMQIAKSLAIIADELSDINQKMEKKW
mgnify:CR=1 FL=1